MSRYKPGIPRELLRRSNATIDDIEVGDIFLVNYPYEEDSQKDINGDSTRGVPRPAIVLLKIPNQERPLVVLKGTTSTVEKYNPSDVIKHVGRIRLNCSSIAMIKPHHCTLYLNHINFYDPDFQEVLQTAYNLDKQGRLKFSTYEEYIMNDNKNYIDILNEGNSKNIIESNCRWDEVYAIYNTLPPHEKLFLGNNFIDSPNTVFRWIVTFNGENAGFIELYDMKGIGSHKGELTISTAICPQYRGMGLLEEMQKKIEEFTYKSKKYDKLIWFAKDANIRSIKCAERLGYKKMYHEKDHWVYKMVINKKPLHEDFNDTLSVYNQLSDDEKKLLSPRGKFIDSPNLIYRYNHLVNGKSVGFIEVYKLNGNSNTTGYITLAIVPKYRSKGISYILIKKAIDGCRSKGYSKLIYRMDNSNIASRTVAEKNGFILNRKGKSYSEYYLIIKDIKEEDIYSEIDSIPIDESYEKMPMVLSENDVYCNMSKFKNPYNIIFVCGTSGSGKSTLSKQIRDMYNVQWVSLDNLMFWLVKKERSPEDVLNQDPILYKYFVEHDIPFDYLHKKYGATKQLGSIKEIREMTIDFCEWISKQKDLYCVVEGLQTTFFHNHRKFILYPFVFKGTSMLKAWYRRINRDNSHIWMDPSRWGNMVEWTKEWKHDIDILRKAVVSNSNDIYTKKEKDIHND